MRIKKQSQSDHDHITCSAAIVGSVGVSKVTEPVAHIYEGDQRVLQLTNEHLLDDFKENDTYRVEEA